MFKRGEPQGGVCEGGCFGESVREQGGYWGPTKDGIVATKSHFQILGLLKKE